MKRLFLYTCLWLTIVPGCSVYPSRITRQTPHFTDHSVIRYDTQYCREPSGIVFSTRRGTLFVVDDEGNICELLTDGTLLQQGHIKKTDLEGITTNPASGLLYVIDEKSGAILELDPNRLEVRRRFTIKTAPGYRDPATDKNNRGFEAITFIANLAHPSGGTFFLADQGRPGNSDKGLARVYEVAVPIHSNTNAEQSADQRATIIRSFTLGITDLSGLHHDDHSGLLHLISDKHDRLILLTSDGAEQASYTLPGKNQEGITMDAEGYVYIAEDSGDIIKYTYSATIKP